jgi:hypothetical protein
MGAIASRTYCKLCQPAHNPSEVSLLSHLVCCLIISRPKATSGLVISGSRGADDQGSLVLLGADRCGTKDDEFALTGRQLEIRMRTWCGTMIGQLRLFSGVDFLTVTTVL